MQLFGTLLTIAFVITSLLLVVLILLQSNRSSGMGLFGGSGSQTAFGAGAADALTKMTSFLTAAFFVLALGMAYLQSRETGYQRLQQEFNQPAQSGAAGGDAATPNIQLTPEVENAPLKAPEAQNDASGENN